MSDGYAENPLCSLGKGWALPTVAVSGLTVLLAKGTTQMLGLAGVALGALMWFTCPDRQGYQAVAGYDRASGHFLYA